MKNNNFYNPIALKRDEFIKNYGSKIKVQGEKGNAFFMQKLDLLIREHKKILEIGTGTGTIPFWLGHIGKKMICIDNAPNMIEIAKNNCQNFPNVTFQVVDLNCFPFEKESFDLIIKRLAPDNINETVRILEKGGSFVNFTNGEKDAFELKDIFNLSRHESIKDFKKNILSNKLEIVEEKEFIFTETYKNLDILIKLLEIAPILPNFNKKREIYESKLLKEFSQNKFIKITRHKYFSHAKKTI
jgi:SAM-dependent methyltransferase